MRERRPVPRVAVELLVVVLGMRLVLAAAAQVVAAGVAAARGVASPMLAAAGWWTVYGTLVDLVSLAVLWLLARREGVGVRSLFNTSRQRLPRELALGLLALLGLAPFVALSSAMAAVLDPGGLPAQIAVIDLPPWAAVYSVALWPVLWAIAEELTYLGYALPRLERHTGVVVAAALVCAAWALQHAVLPILFDAEFALVRVLTALPVVVGQTILFFVFRRRLVPLIVAHWAADLSSVLLGIAT